MKNFTICLAGQYFTICPVCDYIREYCKDYIVADDAVHGIGDSATGRETGNVTRCATNGALETPSRFYIANTQSDIDFEREKSAREDIKEGIPIRHFSDAYLDTCGLSQDCRPPLISRYPAFSWIGHCGRWRRLSFYRKKRYRQVHTYTTVERIFRGACRHGKRR